MMIAMLVNISNIVLGYILIFGVGGIGGFGIYGAAAALTMAQAIGAITGLVLLFKGPYKVFSAEQLKEKIFPLRLEMYQGCLFHRYSGCNRKLFLAVFCHHYEPCHPDLR